MQRWVDRRALLICILKTERKQVTAVTNDENVLLDPRCVRRLLPKMIVSSYNMGMIVRFMPYNTEPDLEEQVKSLLSTPKK